ncbi:hypothetical protein VNO77_25987 [Canavalia gladiata]|uniref:Uncharacterized protein n=1 Tax=Canavalia gladiata TaxID=3824 RepID=A0AAN9KV98_CANGL
MLHTGVDDDDDGVDNDGMLRERRRSSRSDDGSFENDGVLRFTLNDDNDENIQVEIQVCGYDIDGNKFSMVFKKGTEKYYMLNGE